ncbi:OmpA family protein [Saccharicrinis sp. GN24d3]|uniref:OmpA family protein n=1 Tax=Saccharicrinis sp. GN24d3 TaxID=3458416 RepID=UPI004036676F
MKAKLLFILSLIVTLNVNGQTYKNKLDSLWTTYRTIRATKAFDNMAYTKAIAKYEKISINNELPDSVKSLLATAYLNVSETMKSEAAFSSILTDSLSDDALFLYAQALKYNGKYGEADRMMAKYKERSPMDSRAVELLNALPKIEKILAEERYLIEEVSFNSPQSDFAPFVFDDEVYFASARDLDYIIKREYAWKETPYLNVLKTKVRDGGFSNPKLCASELRSMYHDGPVFISPDGNELFITRNTFHSFINTKGRAKGGYNNLRILKSSKVTDGTWMKPEELPFNNKDYSCGHACLSPNGTKLYFSSDMPKGKGGSDIYYVAREGDSWGEPVNLSDLNTEGNEMFPFVHKSGKIYFASNGRVGVGGLDIYVAELRAGAYQVKNMGYPLNSKKDDFGMFLADDGINGYFSSNREGGKGDDDIYRFKVLKEITFKKALKGKLIDKNTRQVIANTPVVLTDSSGKLVGEVMTDENGMLSTEVDDISSITADVTAQGYFPYNETISLLEETAEFEMALKPRPYWGIFGNVFLLPDMKPIPEVTLKMQPKSGTETSIVSGWDGRFKTRLQPETDYDFVFTKKGFFTKRVQYSTAGRDTGCVNINEFMELELEKAEVGKSIEIQILYDLGKWNIREDAAIELEDMIQFLKDNPEIKIELGSHTDARGSAISNQVLSQKRAQSAVDFMEERGIARNRMVAKGYGENQLKNKCADGVQCSEEEHQANRRSEVTIVAM